MRLQPQYFSEFELDCQDFDLIKQYCLSFKTLQCHKAYPVWVTLKVILETFQ